MNEPKTSQTMQEEHYPAAARQSKWAEFVETVVVDFFTNNKLEKIALEDGSGNKAKIARTKDSDLKVEYSTTKLL